MPNIVMTIPETVQSISRPVIYEVIEQVKDITKMPKNIRVIFPGDTDGVAQQGTTIDNKDRNSIFLSNEYLVIQVDEDYDENSFATTAVTQSEQIPVFADPKLGVYIKPVYSTTKVTINFKYRTNSKTQALRWRDDIRFHISQMRDVNLHELEYHYLLPKPYLVLLKEIHRLRENVAGYGQDFAGYLYANATTQMTEIGNEAGSNSELGVGEKQIRVLGMFDFDGMPEKPEKENENGSWVISFGYKFSFEKPIACDMTYPIMIHNQLLDPQYVTFNTSAYSLDNQQKSYSASFEALTTFEAQKQIEKYVNTDPIIRLPEHDEFIPEGYPPATVAVFYALCEVDINDKRALLNLNELGPIVIDKDIMDFIQQSEWPYLTKLYKSFFHVELYRSMKQASDSAITIDSNLNISSVDELDLRVNNRIRFSMVTNLNMIRPEAFDRLRKFPKAFVKIVSAISDSIRNFPGFNDLGSKPIVTKQDFSVVYRAITGANLYTATPNSLAPFGYLKPNELEYYRNNRIQFNRVMLSNVVAVSLK